jgi:hypothetical protein
MVTVLLSSGPPHCHIGPPLHERIALCRPDARVVRVFAHASAPALRGAPLPRLTTFHPAPAEGTLTDEGHLALRGTRRHIHRDDMILVNV